MNNINDTFLILPLDKLNVHKLMLLILKKLELGHIPSNYSQIGNRFEIPFDDSILPRRRKGIVYKEDDEDTQLRITFTEERGKLNITIDNTDRLVTQQHIHGKHYDPYINNYRKITVEGRSYLRLELNRHGQILINDSNLSKIKDLMLNYQILNDNKNYAYTFLNYLESISTQVYFIERRSINQFAKFKKWLDFFNRSPGLPTDESLNTVIDTITSHCKTLNNLNTDGLTAKSSLYSVEYRAANIANKIKLKLGPFTVFNSRYLSRHKYIFHPGLYTFVKYLEASNNIMNFDLTIQKQIFKNV